MSFDESPNLDAHASTVPDLSENSRERASASAVPSRPLRSCSCKLRIDVAAYGRQDTDQDSGDELPLSLDARQRAENAVLRASGVLRFANPDDPAVQELKMLFMQSPRSSCLARWQADLVAGEAASSVPQGLALG